MAEPLGDQIFTKIEQASNLYHRLILVVAPSGSGKTAALRNIQTRISAPLVNVNLELSRRMLDLTERQRTLKLPSLLRDIVGKCECEIVLLDNIEILFDGDLQQDPLRLLLGLSRERTLVVAWNGSMDGDYLTYANVDHPEYKRYQSRDFLVVSPKVST